MKSEYELWRDDLSGEAPSSIPSLVLIALIGLCLGAAISFTWAHQHGLI